MPPNVLTNGEKSDNSVLFDGISAGQIAPAVFLCPAPGAPMRRRGAPSRKSGSRHGNGRLKYEPSIDPGHDATMERRMYMVGSANAHDPRAGYPLGVLWLTHQISADQHDAGLRYAVDHAVVFGIGTAKSHLANAISAIRSTASDFDESKFFLDAADRYGRKVAAVRRLPPPNNPFPFHVLERLAIDEAFSATQPDLAALLRALDALVDFRP